MKKTKIVKSKTKANPMWGGQYSRAPAESFAKINPSIGFDKQLYKYDITGSIAHVQMLAKCKIISTTEAKKIEKGLVAIRKDIETGCFSFKEELEDIHMNIEAALKKKIGAVAGKLHTGRSRNDQVAVDFKLYTRDAFDAVEQELQKLQQALLERAEEYAGTLMPGFTHLQVAQPVTFGHHLMAYVEMFGRDRSRMSDARTRMNESPLGAAALAGTPYPIDRKMTAKALGFDRPMANSMDAVSDRDFALEFLSAASICMVHLSRLAEEMVLWSSAQFGFIRFSDEFSTGSSIMPQKRNPDAAELIRGKSGRIFGSLVSLLTMMKALPLAYNKDMQEDKEPVFDAAEQLLLCVSAMCGMVLDLEADTEVMAGACEFGFANATDLADWLVSELDLPFREAHTTTAKLVKLARKKNCKLEELSLAEMKRIHSKIDKSIYPMLRLNSSLASRKSEGGTAPQNVKHAIKVAKKRFDL